MFIWFIVAPIIGGGLGWLLGRFNSRAARRECEPAAFTWKATSNPWSGTITGAIFGLIIAFLINSSG